MLGYPRRFHYAFIRMGVFPRNRCALRGSTCPRCPRQRGEEIGNSSILIAHSFYESSRKQCIPLVSVQGQYRISPEERNGGLFLATSSTRGHRLPVNTGSFLFCSLLESHAFLGDDSFAFVQWAVSSSFFFFSRSRCSPTSQESQMIFQDVRLL